MRSFRQFLIALARDRGGLAYIEMALLSPVLVAMYCGSYVVSDMVTCGRKVSLSARSITDLTSQYASVSTTDLTSVLTNAALVLAPYDSSLAQLRVSEVQVSDASHATVIWSQGKNATALVAGVTVTLPTNMAPPLMVPSNANGNVGGYFIMGEISYTYAPAFGAGWIPSVNLYNRYFMLPRLSTNINHT